MAETRDLEIIIQNVVATATLDQKIDLLDARAIIKRGTMRTPGMVEVRIQGDYYFLRHRTAIPN